MPNSVVDDAIKTIAWILDGTIPSDKYVVVNIAKSSNPFFIYPGNKEIPTSYGYGYDRTPALLMQEKCVLGMVPKRWFVGTTKENPRYKVMGNYELASLTTLGRKLKAINDDEYYRNYLGEYSHMGPNETGQYAILLDVEASRNYYWRVKGLVPTFNNGSLNFLGQLLTFEKQQANGVEVLIKNINSIVGMESFYSAVYDKNPKEYLSEIAENGKTGVHDKLESIIKQIRAKIDANRILEKALLMVRHDGFGMFIDHKQANTPLSS